VASVVRRMNEVTLRRARLVLGWVTVFGRGYTITVCNQPTRSTQPCIPSCGVAKSSTSFGWGKGWNVTSAGWQVTLCDPVWHVSSSSGVATSVSELLYPCYFTLLTTYVTRVDSPREYALSSIVVIVFERVRLRWIRACSPRYARHRA